MVPSLTRGTGCLPTSSANEGSGEQSLSHRPPSAVLQRMWRMAKYLLMIPSLRVYLSHPTFLPSFALSLLYCTVLSFSGQMLTYLLGSHIRLWQVGVIRGISTFFELSATWITPRLMKRIGVLRTGLWSISWQMTWLAGGMTWFFYYYGCGYPANSLIPAAGLATAAALSRMGLWGYDLSVQNIVQDVSLTVTTLVLV